MLLGMPITKSEKKPTTSLVFIDGKGIHDRLK